jgi:hypothetical protein
MDGVILSGEHVTGCRRIVFIMEWVRVSELQGAPFSWRSQFLQFDH